MNVPGFLLGAGAIALGTAGIFAARQTPTTASDLTDRGFTGKVPEVSASPPPETWATGYYVRTGPARRIVSLVGLIVIVVIIGVVLALGLYSGVHGLIDQIVKLSSPSPTVLPSA